MVARERFELSSMAPKATMLGHYTTGLWHSVVCAAFCYEVLRTGLFLISILACDGSMVKKFPAGLELHC
jgi:hypothetical protein